MKLFLQILGFFICNLVLYVLGSFIVWDFNPTNWMLITTWFGRIILLPIELFYLVVSIRAGEETYENYLVKKNLKRYGKEKD